VLHENKEQLWVHPLDQVCSIFHVLRATSKKFGLHEGNLGKIWFACGQLWKN
jgi:hypothetical protein